jgi:hypothetical protein
MGFNGKNWGGIRYKERFILNEETNIQYKGKSRNRRTIPENTQAVTVMKEL